MNRHIYVCVYIYMHLYLHGIVEGEILLHFHLFILTLEKEFKLSRYQTINLLCVPIFLIKWG